MLTKIKQGGFSLIESVLAIAIVGSAVLTLVGLLPSGLDDLHKSSMKQAEARIIQTVVGDYQMRSWGSAGSNMGLKDREYYFDIRGSMVTKGTLEHSITAKTQMDPQNPSLPGDSTPAKHLRRIKILFSTQIQNPDAFTNADLHHERNIWIANVDQTAF